MQGAVAVAHIHLQLLQPQVVQVVVALQQVRQVKQALLELQTRVVAVAAVQT
jgi:hypothetical protein